MELLIIDEYKFIKYYVIVLNEKGLILLCDIKKYYENTENALPNPMVKKL